MAKLGPAAVLRQAALGTAAGRPTPRPSHLVIVDIIAPIFGIVLIGWLAARLRAFDEAATRGVSLFAFNFAIPVMLLRTLAGCRAAAAAGMGIARGLLRRGRAVFALGGWGRREAVRQRGAAPAIFGISAAFSNTIIWASQSCCGRSATPPRYRCR